MCHGVRAAAAGCNAQTCSKFDFGITFEKRVLISFGKRSMHNNPPTAPAVLFCGGMKYDATRAGTSPPRCSREGLHLNCQNRPIATHGG